MDSSDNPVAGWMLFLLFIVINEYFLRIRFRDPEPQ